MQRSPQEIKDTLLKALDQDYNVINMPVVVEIIGILEQTPITKEALESTRLGKFINELRRKTTNDNVAKRAKDLVRKWRDLIVPEPAAGANGVRPVHKVQLSPGLQAKRSQPASPASRVSSLSPETKLAPSPAISPRLQGYSPLPAAPLDNGTPAPRGRGRPPNSSYASGKASATPQTSPRVPRQRGRPPKNKNKHKRAATDLVPKTSPANKRLRKNSPEPYLNGVSSPQVPVPETSRTPKVKTTRQLLQSIQQESSLDALRSKTLTSLGVPNKSPRAPPTPRPDPPKFLPKRQPATAPPPAPPSPASSDIVEVEKIDEPVKLPKPFETVEEILARLPPVDADAIRWSDDSDSASEPDEVTPDVTCLDRHVEGLNGNHTDGACPEGASHGVKMALPATHGSTPSLCPADCSFREWHETLSRASYQGELLHILPYVVID